MSDLGLYEVSVYEGHDGKGGPLGNPIRSFTSELISREGLREKWVPGLGLKVGEMAKFKKLGPSPDPDRR